MQEVISALSQSDNLRAVAVIVGLEGPAYRPLGAMMAVNDDQSFVGHVSSGCIEADIIGHCQNLTEAKVLKYGAGSPFLDLRLPCGGGMEILLVPKPDQSVFQHVEAALNQRQETAFSISLETGEVAMSDARETKVVDGVIHIHRTPPLRFFIYGNGYEAKVFAELTEGAGYPVELFSTNADTVEKCRISAQSRHLMTTPKIADIQAIDRWTSIALFFHEHDLEEQILIDALQTKAFYIGAQGGYPTHQRRLADLEAKQIKDLDRIKGPIGLIPSSRDPQTLAISVLAEIHAVANQAKP